MHVLQVYEQYTAAKLGINVTVIMPQEQKASLRRALNKHGGLKRVSACLSEIDVEKAEATVEEDEVKVKRSIKSTVGFKAVNQRVRQSMVTMALKECAIMLVDPTGAPAGSLLGLLRSCRLEEHIDAFTEHFKDLGGLLEVIENDGSFDQLQQFLLSKQMGLKYLDCSRLQKELQQREHLPVDM